jgi:hypothetical protein
MNDGWKEAHNTTLDWLGTVRNVISFLLEISLELEN